MRAGARATFASLHAQVGLDVADDSFPAVAEVLAHTWTRNAFDRLIVGQAATSRVELLTSDDAVHDNFAGAFGEWPPTCPLGCTKMGSQSQRHPVSLLVFGAGEAGTQAVRVLLGDPKREFVPVALLDDDPAKRDLQVMGVPVVGDRASLAEAARRHSAETVLIAMPSVDPSVTSEVVRSAEHAGLDVKVLPSVSALLGLGQGAEDLRDIDDDELLGRPPVQLGVQKAAEQVSGRRVLVTGAGGSIGAELCRQVARLRPSELVMLDSNEAGLHAAELASRGTALLDSPDVVLADIRERERLVRLFARRRPQIVFHAAALKHLPLLERYPAEAVRTNVWGTLNVLVAAAGGGVERLINISTDKAADPVSVLGYSKRVGERLTAHFGLPHRGTFVSVRFGNVIGSSGSVLTTFRAQARAGGPITVTDPDVTRYFMTVGEAVALVIQAGVVGRNGEVLVLDMGTPVRIDEVARRLAARSRGPVSVTYTGLRPGEKLHETLFSRSETDSRPFHPLIAHVAANPLAPAQATGIDLDQSDEEIISALREVSDG